MKTCPKEAKKYSSAKDSKEQPRDICTHDPEETNTMVLIRKKEIVKAILGRKFSNMFPFPDEEQDHYYEPEEPAGTRRSITAIRTSASLR